MYAVDTGTPLDIVDQSDVSSHKGLIHPVKPLLIATANGESRADRGIDLHLGALGETDVSGEEAQRPRAQTTCVAELCYGTHKHTLRA